MVILLQYNFSIIKEDIGCRSGVTVRDSHYDTDFRMGCPSDVTAKNPQSKHSEVEAERADIQGLPQLHSETEGSCSGNKQESHPKFILNSNVYHYCELRKAL